MIVRKLRLQRGWSQEQLAELTDLSVRTIQRAERGQKPSLETARSLASVFEVDISTFNRGVEPMNHNQEPNQISQDSNYDLNQPPLKEDIKDDEKQAIEYVKGIKEFYTHLFMYVVFCLTIFIFKAFKKLLNIGQDQLGRCIFLVPFCYKITNGIIYRPIIGHNIVAPLYDIVRVIFGIQFFEIDRNFLRSQFKYSTLSHAMPR